jgi:hypothetical protein
MMDDMDAPADRSLRAWADEVTGDLVLPGVEVAVEPAKSQRATFLRYRVVVDIPNTPGDNASAALANDVAHRLAEAANRDHTLGGTFGKADVERDFDNELNPLGVRTGYRRLIMTVFVERDHPPDGRLVT